HNHSDSVNMAASTENSAAMKEYSVNSCRNSSTDICPYCRSFRAEFNETDRKFKMCSEQQRPSSANINQHHNCCSSGSLMSSPNTHLCSYHNHSSNTNSQIQTYPLSRSSSSSLSIRHM